MKVLNDSMLLRFTALETQKTKLLLDNTALRKDVDKLDIDNKSLQKDNTSLLKDVTDLKLDNTSLHKDVTDLEKDNKTLLKDVTELRKDVTKTKTQISVLNDCNSNLQFKVTRLEFPFREAAIAHLVFCIARRDQCELELSNFRLEYPNESVISQTLCYILALLN